MREDVESLARALGVWWDGLPRRPPTAAPWCMSRRDGVHRIHRCEDTAITFPGIVVDPPTAALILLGHASGLRVDIGECTACRGTAKQHYGVDRDRPSHVPWSHWQGWLPGSGPQWCARRPCPSCNIDGEPPGRDTVAWERAVVDAMSRHTDTRTPLAVLADQLQTCGDILGTFVAEWLAGPCPACEGSRLQGGRTTDALDRRPDRLLCRRCHGHGTMLGQREPELRACLQAAAAIAEAAPDERATVLA